MSIASEIKRLQNARTAIKTAIQSKGVTVNPDPGFSGYADLIYSIPQEGGGGGGTTTEAALNTYNLIDYDGRIVASYNEDEFEAATTGGTLPDAPYHPGLVSQGWNFFLPTREEMTSTDSQTEADSEKAKAYMYGIGTLLSNAGGFIGQNYTTSNGATRVYADISVGRLAPYLAVGVNGTVAIDWGDGNTDTLTGTDSSVLSSIQHTYQTTGTYVISLTVTGEMKIFATANGSVLLCKNPNSVSGYDRCYENAIRKVEIGDNTIIGEYAFQYCYSLESISLPNTLTSIGAHAFSDCYSLRGIVIPTSITSVGPYAFNKCYALRNVSLPYALTEISDSMFNMCYSLQNVAIPFLATRIGAYAFNANVSMTRICVPRNVATIAKDAFASCSGVNIYVFQSATPPVVEARSAFSGILSDCTIYVQDDKVDTYKNATNYPSAPTYASAQDISWPMMDFEITGQG